MSDHNNRSLTTREMVRAAIPFWLPSTPGPADDRRPAGAPGDGTTFNRCVDAQINMRDAINAGSQTGPGRVNELKAFEHCHGR